MSHTKLGKINIAQAQTILIVWTWDIVNDGNVALWASQHVEFVHDIGYGTRWRWNPFGVPSYAGSDDPWVIWEPGVGKTLDIFEDYGAKAMVAPDKSGSIAGNFDAAWIGSLQLPGPAQSATLKNFWDEQSDDGAEFHLKLSLYQQDRANLVMSASERLDDHDFHFLFGVTTDNPPLRVLGGRRADDAEQPSVGIYTQ